MCKFDNVVCNTVFSFVIDVFDKKGWPQYGTLQYSVLKISPVEIISIKDDP